MDSISKQQWLHKDRQYIWHPFTQMKDYETREHLLIDRAEGIMLYDMDGNSYYDTNSSWWVNIHGHGHSRIKQAVMRQLDRMDHIMFSGITHKPAIELAERLIELTPAPLTKVFYSDNGSTAVEVALKMSFQYWQHKGFHRKIKFVYANQSYHGDTIGAVSVGGVDTYHALYKPLLFHTYQVSTPHHQVRAWLEEVRQLFAQHADEIAGFIIEPMILAAGGMIMYPADILIGLRKLCDEFNIHLIADEVAVGFGRTGRMFACEHADISPDLLCLSKGLTAGIMPLSVTCCTEDIYQAFYDNDTYKTFFHGHSFTGNPLSASVALESLHIFQDEQVMERTLETSSHLAEKLKSFQEFAHIDHIRQLGLVAAFNIVKDKTKSSTYDPTDRIGFQVYHESLKEGLLLRPLGDVLYYWLPLCVTTSQIDDIVMRTIKVFNRMNLV